MTEVGGIVFGDSFQHRFQNNTLWVVGDGFGGRFDLDSVFTQPHFIQGTVLSVSGKTVEFPNDDIIPALTGAVGNHFFRYPFEYSFL